MRARKGSEMTALRATIVAVLAAQLSGCAWLESRWPWRKKEVPVTRPDESAPLRPEELAAARVAERAPAPPAPAATTATAPAAAPTTRESPPLPARYNRTGESEVVAASLLQVNHEFFTVDDILRAAAPALKAAAQGESRVAFTVEARKIIQATMQEQVGRALIFEEAKRNLSDQQRAIIDDELDKQMKATFAEMGGRQRVERLLAEEGTTLKRYQEQMQRTLTVQTYLRAKFEPQIQASRRMLLEYYRDHRDEFTTPKKVQMQIIAAPFAAFLPEGVRAPTDEQQADARRKARQTIDAAADALKSGEDFARVATRLSRGVRGGEGGTWPLMEVGSFRESEVEKAAFALAEGQVSDVVTTDRGHYIVRAQRVSPAKTGSFEEAQLQIARKLRDAQQRRLTSDYFRKLLEKAVVRESPELTDLAVQRAVDRHWRP